MILVFVDISSILSLLDLGEVYFLSSSLVATIDFSTQTIAQNEDRTVTAEATSINNKEKIRTNVDGVKNNINKSLDPHIVDKGNRKVNDDKSKKYKVLEKSVII